MFKNKFFDVKDYVEIGAATVVAAGITALIYECGPSLYGWIRGFLRRNTVS